MSNVANRAAALLEHDQHLILHAQENAAHVDGNDPIPVVLRYVGNRAIRLLDAGIVEGHIDAAEGCNSLIQGGFYVIGLPHIASDSKGPTSELLDQTGCFLASSDMSATIALAPSCANAMALARPMPLVAL